MIPRPCPFCGGKDIYVVEGSTFRWRVAECSDCGARSGETRAQTIGTLDRVGDDNRAIEEWNIRARKDGLRNFLSRYEAEFLVDLLEVYIDVDHDVMATELARDIRALFGMVSRERELESGNAPITFEPNRR